LFVEFNLAKIYVRLNFVEKVNFFLQGKIDKLMYNNILLSHKNSIFIPNLIERFISVLKAKKDRLKG